MLKKFSAMILIMLIAISFINPVCATDLRNEKFDFVTREEAAFILDNLIKFPVTGINHFKDISDSEYKDSITKINIAGIMTGDGEGKFFPKRFITVEETIKTLIAAFQIPLSYDYSCLDIFEDSFTISKWAEPYIAAFIKAGYFDHILETKIEADKYITREKFLNFINQIIGQNIDKEQTIKDEKFEKDIIITSNNVIFENCRLNKVYISPSVDADTIVFDPYTEIKETKILLDGLYMDLKARNGDYIYYLSSFTTAFDHKNINRSTNLKLSLTAINGTVLEPGETFSFNKIVGQRTALKGYKVAGIIVGKKNSQGLGGGVCQTATTLYNAALLAGLQIIERRQHGIKVPYVDPGMDATVYWSSNIDMKFKNIYPVSVKIIGDYNPNGTMSFLLYSNEKIDLPEIEIKTFKQNGVWVLQQIIDDKVKYTTKSVY